MSAQIRFTLRLFVRSGRWLAPLALFTLWFSFAIVNSPPALSTSSSLVPALLTCGVWMTAAMGSIDDRNHREILTAAAGSPARLHIARTLSSLVVCLGVAAVCIAYIAFSLDHPDISTVEVAAINAVALLAASLLAVAIGSWLHPPIIEHRAVAVLAGLVAIVAVVVFPPVGATLRSLGRGSLAPTVVFGVVAAVVGIGVVAASSRMTNRS